MLNVLWYFFLSNFMNVFLGDAGEVRITTPFSIPTDDGKSLRNFPENVDTLVSVVLGLISYLIDTAVCCKVLTTLDRSNFRHKPRKLIVGCYLH